ncbi:hypothetical protein C4D60_Mb07t16270 [Musa balbisiana]|uniref:EF-hand domain-containing protein n=1 Tax=Musa balbisiana TaxID=52838 RepID=A0A4S8JI72_MUSBA|nr:hypothetical protein C4D60_Mb07t16270 [Musa balbisiana]
MVCCYRMEMELVYQSAAFVLCHSLSDKVRFQHRSQLIMDDIAEECTGFEEKETDSLKSMINAECRVFVISCYHISLRGNMRQMRILEFRYNVEKLKEKKWISRKDSQASDLKPRFETDEEDMKKVFNKISNDKDRIEFSDLRQLLHKMNVRDADREAKQMMQAADFNNDGFLDFDEFMKVTKDVSMRDLKDAFGMFDDDRDGRISAEEIKRMMEKLGESCTLEDCARMVKQVDKNGDGLVDMEEFIAMMTGTKEPI